jgi:hypothetical protein
MSMEIRIDGEVKPVNVIKSRDAANARNYSYYSTLRHHNTLKLI